MKMEFTVRKFRKETLIHEKKKITLQGYSFIDKLGGTIIIAYGENRRDFLIKQLSKNKKQ